MAMSISKTPLDIIITCLKIKDYFEGALRGSFSFAYYIGFFLDNPPQLCYNVGKNTEFNGGGIRNEY